MSMAIVNFRTVDGCCNAISGEPEELAQEFVNRMGYGAEDWCCTQATSADGVVTAWMKGTTVEELYRLAGGRVYSCHLYSEEDLRREVDRLLVEEGAEIVDIRVLPPKPMSYMQPELGDLPPAYEVRYRSKT